MFLQFASLIALDIVKTRELMVVEGATKLGIGFCIIQLELMRIFVMYANANKFWYRVHLIVLPLKCTHKAAHKESRCHPHRVFSFPKNFPCQILSLKYSLRIGNSQVSSFSSSLKEMLRSTQENLTTFQSNSFVPKSFICPPSLTLSFSDLSY